MMNNILIFIKQISLLLSILMIQLTTAVNTFPEILTKTHNETFNLSSTAILTCHIHDLGEHHVTWFKIDPITSISSPLAVGKQLFTNDERYSISFYLTSERESFWLLEIYQLNLSDEGTYICKIANRRASVNISINLHIQIPMTIHPIYIYNEPGTNIKLNCSILINNNNNSNKSSITWHHLSNQLNKTKSRDIYHTGIWTCVYRNQRVSSKVIIQKGILKHQRTSALLSNNSNRNISSINFFLFVLFIVYKY